MAPTALLSGALTAQLVSVLVGSVRIAVILAFAPPFTYLPAPASFRVLLALGLGACFLGLRQTVSSTLSPVALLQSFGVELFVGLAFTLALQLAFGALEVAGRTLDMQAGQGLTGVIDAATSSASPLSGMLLTRAAAAIFFTVGDQSAFTRVLAASYEMAPASASISPPAIAHLGALATALTGLGLSIAASAIAVLLLCDLTIAFLARTAPQINALMLGLQVKSIALLVTLPVLFIGSGAMFDQLLDSALSGAVALARS